MDHHEGDGDGGSLSQYSWDYCFPGDELGFKWTVLVGKERRGKLRMATAIPAQGSTGQFGVDQCLEFIEENGDAETDIIIKSDQAEREDNPRGSG